MFSDILSIQTEIDNLHHIVLSLVISTIANNGQLHTSYAPYLNEGGYYYIPASQITPYYQYLQTDTTIGLMIIEDEQQAKNICSRTRLCCQALAEIVPPSSAEFIYVVNELKQRIGNMMDLFIALNNFKLIRMRPQTGNLMLGLTKIYELYCQEVNNNLPLLQIV